MDKEDERFSHYVTIYKGDISELEEIRPTDQLLEVAWNRHLPQPITKESKVYIHPDQEGLAPQYVRIVHGIDRMIECVYGKYDFEKWYRGWTKKAKFKDTESHIFDFKSGKGECAFGCIEFNSYPDLHFILEEKELDLSVPYILHCGTNIIYRGDEFDQIKASEVDEQTKKAIDEFITGIDPESYNRNQVNQTFKYREMRYRGKKTAPSDD